VATDRNSAAVVDDLKAKVEASDRMNRIHDAMAKKILATYEKDVVAQQDIWSYSDSVLEQKATQTVKVQITPQSPLFYIGMQAITAADWIMYVQMNRYNSNGGGVKPYSQLWEAFRCQQRWTITKPILNSSILHFKAQLEEFRDGNLFFEIMQKEVWGPAQTDTAALEVYYAKHKEKYQWKESAEAVVFYINDIATAKIFEKALLQSPGQWKTILTHYDQLVIADSNRYEITTLPGITKALWRAGAFSPLVINKEENTATLSISLLKPITVRSSVASVTQKD
jgi:peptidyl-prolyl cis-trans isomerase SurA